MSDGRLDQRDPRRRNVTILPVVTVTRWAALAAVGEVLLLWKWVGTEGVAGAGRIPAGSAAVVDVRVPVGPAVLGSLTAAVVAW